ncbi:autotransporter outer membrane beta-barrel domain-containing protein [soil metagenome]
MATLLATTALCTLSQTARAQALDFTTFVYPGSSVNTVTGIRGNNMTGNYSLGAGGNTGSLLYTLPSLTPAPFPIATASGVNFPFNATSATPYGPNFGSAGGILRVVGSYKTAATGAGDLGFLYDGAAAPGQQITTLIAPAGPNASPNTINTIAHSNFGNQVVGNFDTRLATGHAFLYDIPSNTFTTINRPGATSTTAYGVYGNRIAGGSTDGTGLSRAYILNQTTGVYTSYDAPNTRPGVGTVVTHFEGITSGGRANTYNLVADSVDSSGVHAWAVHVDENGTASWTEVAVPVPAGSPSVTSGNSIYGNTAIGVYTLNGVTSNYIVNVPGIYNPITNNGTLTIATPGAAAISSNGDDIVNNGSIIASATSSIGISSGTYGVITNNGTIGASGSSATAVQMTGTFGTLLNYGTITGSGANSFALQTDSTASGTVVVNYGTINGQVSMAAGPYARFENSGWMGITAPGAGVTHTVSGTFAQTSAGTLALRVAPNGVSDQLVVNGQARLAGTALAVFQPGFLSKSYTLVTATGGLTGTFSTLATQNLPAFITASLGYGATNVTLSLQSGLGSLAGVGGNQRAVGRALDGAFNGGAGLNAVPGLYGLSANQIEHALDVLSGSNASVAASAQIAAGSQFSALMANRGITRRSDAQPAAQASAPQTSVDLASCQAEACDPVPLWSAWASAFGGAQWLKADSSTASPAAQQAVGGGAFGADYRLLPQTLVGLAVGLSDTNYSVGATGASGRATGFHAGLYGTQEWNGFYLNGAVAYGRYDGTNTRSIAGIGQTETAKSTVISNQFGGRVEIGRPFELTDPGAASRYSVSPFAALQPTVLWTPGTSESSVTATGAPGVFALTYQAQSTSSLPLFVGAQFDASTEVRARPLNAWFRLAWVHDFLTSRNVTAGFNVLPGTSFTVDGAPAASNAVRVDLGAKYAVGSQTYLFANGSAELSYRGQAIAGTVGLRFTW